MSSEPIPDLAQMRRNYLKGELRRKDLAEDPIVQFTTWLKDACEAGVHEPNAMSLATVGKDGRSSLRTVLLKHYDGDGFVFYTNYESRKSRELSQNPYASLLFPWLLVERQVVISGRVEKVSAAETEKYFHARPRDSQLAAWASPQSTVVDNREFLLQEWESMKTKFAERDIPVPPFWGGWRVVPEVIEFWQGGANRIHDRFVYSKNSQNGWSIERLAP